MAQNDRVIFKIVKTGVRYFFDMHGLRNLSQKVRFVKIPCL